MGCCLSAFPALKNHFSSLELVLYTEVLWNHVNIMSFLKKFAYSFCEFLPCMYAHACWNQRLVFGVFFNFHFETGLRLCEARTHWLARLVGLTIIYLLSLPSSPPITIHNTSITDTSQHSSLYVGAGDPNSGPYTYLQTLCLLSQIPNFLFIEF